MENNYDKKVYEVEEIQHILGISRTSVYEFIKETAKEITVFAHEVLPREKEIEIIPIDERYLLEVLP